LLTGFADFQHAKQAIELQAVNYLLKPVRTEELLPSIRAIANRLDGRRTAEDQRERIAAEERRRIGHDLHDILGFTLTSTLMNLEAAKMLLTANREEGLRRLEQSSELLRTGMLTIRQAVRTVQNGAQESDLVESLKAFLADAERLAGVTVACSFEAESAMVDAASRKQLCTPCRKASRTAFAMAARLGFCSGCSRAIMNSYCRFGTTAARTTAETRPALASPPCANASKRGAARSTCRRRKSRRERCSGCASRTDPDGRQTAAVQRFLDKLGAPRCGVLFSFG